VEFKLASTYKPAGDQPKAIEALTKGLASDLPHQTLLGATGTGKTFTIANVIEKVQKPTLVIAHNKTLAAQLAQEYREFFPNNAVHYFVSYYDYYQPEAYMPVTDTYIEKEAMINEEIDRLRHASTQALLSRKDVIIVASVSCIYGLGSPEEYQKVHLKLAIGEKLTRAELIRRLVHIYFTRTTADLTPGTFRARGNRVEIMPTNERVIYRLDFANEAIAEILVLDATTMDIRGNEASLFVFPAKHFVTPEGERQRAIQDIEIELKERLKELDAHGKILEHERLKRRTMHDLALIREVGYCNGIENYSRHFDGRKPGEPPHTLLSYFPKKKDGSADFLTVIDESHVTVPQIGGMYAGDQARKKTLIEHGFRLPSAADNRPLQFNEFEARVGKVIFTSATPGKYEFEKSCSEACRAHSENVSVDDAAFSRAVHGFNLACCREKGALVEQIIRPTGLLDPVLNVRPIIPKATFKGQVQDFIEETVQAVQKGGRVLVTTLTKRMAEDLAEYLKERDVKAEYLHSDVKTIDRITILTEFRKGTFDVLVGVNLLREGLDLPEVSLVGILDADKEGFLRSETSLIQTIGRAARNVYGTVILYADEMTGSMKAAIDETNRRRAIQESYNKEHGITPQTIKKNIRDITDTIRTEHQKTVETLLAVDRERYKQSPKALIKEKTRQMNEAVKILDFETAAILRDEIRALESQK
jgi:excinuclease ABC subunit B